MSFLLRGYVYTELAVYLRISYNPHPYRALVLSGETLQCAGILPSLADLTTKWINNLREQLLISSARGGVEPFFELQMPSLFACILRECGTIEEGMRVALQMRNAKSAKAFRKRAKKVMNDLQENKAGELRQFCSDLNELSSRMRKEFGIEEKSTYVSLWLFSFSAKVPRFLHKTIWNGPHLRLLYDTVAKATDIVGLTGELRRLKVELGNRLP